MNDNNGNEEVSESIVECLKDIGFEANSIYL